MIVPPSRTDLIGIQWDDLWPRIKARRTKINRGVHSSNIGEATRFPILFSFSSQDPRDL